MQLIYKLFVISNSDHKSTEYGRTQFAPTAMQKACLIQTAIPQRMPNQGGAKVADAVQTLQKKRFCKEADRRTTLCNANEDDDAEALSV